MLRVLELYSGIGGLHFALEESGISHDVVGAADINNVANDIYKHNFPETKIIQRSIESLSVKELDRLSPDLIHMSPPCQPFVRVGKQQDAGDVRTKSFLHLIEIIPQLKKQPLYLFLENVKGFDISETRDVLLKMLQDSGYLCQEFLLSPLQFGIPNSRLRYYLLAKLRPRPFSFEIRNEIWKDLPDCALPFLVHLENQNSDQNTSTAHKNTNSPVVDDHSENKTSQINCSSETCASMDIKDASSPSAGSVSTLPDDETDLPLYKRYHSVCQPLSEYLEAGPEDHLQCHAIPEKFLPRFWVMDIVKPQSRNTCCFTKRYGHHIEGAGSVLQTVDCSQVDLTQYKRDRVYTAEVEQGVSSLKLRFFTAREIANLMCFPKKFGFPTDVSTIQCYRVLGNSLNVHVVSVLLRLLVLGDNS